MPQPEGIQPGVYLDMPMTTYHEDPAIGGEAIKAILESDEMYWNSCLNPHRERKDENHFKFGRAYHLMILEPEKPFPFEIKKGVGTTKAEGYIGEGDYKKLLRMYKRLTEQPKHWNALHGGIAEASVFWRDKETGLMCKIRPDNWASKYVADLKTAQSVSDKEFFYAFPRNYYHLSGYRYSRGMMAVKEMIREGYQLPSRFDKEFVEEFMAQERQLFCFVMQEKDEPFSTRNRVMTPWCSEQGYTVWRQGMAKLKNYWENPKYFEGAKPLAYPDAENIDEGDIWISTKF